MLGFKCGIRVYRLVLRVDEEALVTDAGTVDLLKNFSLILQNRVVARAPKDGLSI